MEKIGEGFMYEVFRKEDGTVLKKPRTTRHTTATSEVENYQLYKDEFKGNVADGDIQKLTGENFEFHQEFIDGTPVDLAKEFHKDDVQEILGIGNELQDSTGKLFDLFGLKGLINIFNHYESGVLGKMSDTVLPISATYLQYMHHFPKELLFEMNKDTGVSPFIAYNLLRSKEGKLIIIDTDDRILDIRHPLNLLGKIYTKKVLDELSSGEKV